MRVWIRTSPGFSRVRHGRQPVRSEVAFACSQISASRRDRSDHDYQWQLRKGYHCDKWVPRYVNQLFSAAATNSAPFGRIRGRGDNGDPRFRQKSAIVAMRRAGSRRKAMGVAPSGSSGTGTSCRMWHAAVGKRETSHAGAVAH